MALYDTALNIISDAAVELGLGAVSDAYGSTDANVVQLRTLLKSVGRRLNMERDWTQLRQEYTFTTTTATVYTLPADFLDMVPQSFWDRSQNTQGVPIGVEVWQYLVASDVTTPLTVYFQIGGVGPGLRMPVAPTSGNTIALEYRSRYWVAAAAAPTTPAKDAPTANTDVILFDATLMVPALRLAFCKAKGLPTEAAQADHDRALALVSGANAGAAPVLSLVAGPVRERFLDETNAPTTGLGLGDGGLF